MTPSISDIDARPWVFDGGHEVHPWPPETRPIPAHLDTLPSEVLLQILDHLDVCDLMSTSRVSHIAAKVKAGWRISSLQSWRRPTTISALYH